MGREHIANLSFIDGATVTAIADPNSDSRDRALGQVASSMPGASVRAFTHHQELFDSGLCDAVIIATPNFTHATVLKDALATELHVFIEKPLCTTISDCIDVIEWAEQRSHRSKALVWMGLEYRYMPPVAELIKITDSGGVGRVHQVAIREHREPFYPKVDDWNRFNEFTGGTLVEKCCHFFDLMYHLTRSEPIAVMASSADVVNHRDERYQGRSPDIIDNAYVIVEFANGSRGMLELCMFAEGSRDEQVISVVGDAAKAEARIPSGECSLGLRTSGASGVKTTRVQRDSPHEGLHHGSSFREHLAFAGAIRGESSKVATLIDGLRSVAVGVAAHRSIAESRRVTLEEVGYVG